MQLVDLEKKLLEAGGLCLASDNRAAAFFLVIENSSSILCCASIRLAQAQSGDQRIFSKPNFKTPSMSSARIFRCSSYRLSVSICAI